jgi:hypothetical protein
MPLPVSERPKKIPSIKNKKTFGKTLGKTLDKIKNKSWVTVEGWFGMAKGLVIVGFVVFIISSFAGQFDGQLTAYYCMAIGILITLAMSTILASRKNKNDLPLIQLMFSMGSLYLPSILTLIPIVILIIVFTTLRQTIEQDKNHLPTKFYFYHSVTVFFLFLQLLLLNKFLSGEIGTLLNKTNPYKGAQIAGFVFSFILCMAFVSELYVIITRFITDG